MKSVTIETVRERLAHLEGLNARGVGTAVPQQQFELACLRELLPRMESRTVTVKLPAYPEPSDPFLRMNMKAVRTMDVQAMTAAGIQVIEGEQQ